MKFWATEAPIETPTPTPPPASEAAAAAMIALIEEVSEAESTTFPALWRVLSAT